MSDNVNNPKHYNQGGIECIDAIKAATVDKTGIDAFCVGNAIKYLFRYKEKNGLEDVKKAAWYIDRLIKELEPDIVKMDEEDCMHCSECVFNTVPDGQLPCTKCKNYFVDGTEEWKKAELQFMPNPENDA